MNGKVAVVTGGSRGIGFAIARAFLEQGIHVTIAGTSRPTLESAAAKLQASAAAGARVHPVAADVRDYGAVTALMRSAVDTFGGLDILVNNAGVGKFTSVADMSAEDWDTVIGTNLTGVFNCCHAALPHLRARGGGWIISISSLAGKNPFADGAAYCASKAGLNAFSEALMQEVRHDGIRVACVLPGSVSTEFGGPSTPLGTGQARQQADWKLTAEDVALAVTNLLAHPARSLPSRIELRPARPPKKS